ncbi:protein trichome birefringence-like 43 isoform X1 [Benincasa hispida]|uniref:protein trichome birefringence-like 43 isoform X1 n=1 Tax=Benincasa hispida TaxID=102211 RepID=UPI00190060CF|nr:protein trichome birefringence-like 43 isoform X1 [Benincasa hispida]
MSGSAIFYVALFLVLPSLLYQEVQGKPLIGGCDLFQGRWVADVSYPLYNVSDCPFVEKEFDCLGNGRPDQLYLRYRWQPEGCLLPRFNGEAFLRQFSGKSIMFVGDSLSLNQWQSFTCMLHKFAPQATYTITRIGALSKFTFLEYKLNIMFSRNAFLVDIIGTKMGRVLMLDSIETAKMWKGIDVLIFNSWHWWLHTGRKQPWDLIEDGKNMYKDMNRLVAYEKGLRTWAKWINQNVDPSKTKIFFQGVSPDHSDGKLWGEAGGNCSEKTRILGGPEYPGGPHPAEQTVERVLEGMSKPVYLLNITKLSQLRIDGHPSVYGSGGHRAMDCSHWCLAGVPDTWNELLYAALLPNNNHHHL